ncbi:MAG: class I SAM-dependent methyltransferase [Flavobacteriales bacterium]|nr:class I SAM-dependent methyltransferase [Flavobacteriales bacterium]
METLINDISAAQKASWNKFSAGWKKWDDLTMKFLAPAGEAIMDHLGATGTSVVLDIAAGTGEPGLSIAKHLHGGKVIITDLAEHMLEVAREKAAAAGITNVEFQEADANALPFADNSFDEISCRMGFMFFPDMQKAANEMARVLKPGGRIATTVWAGPEKNFWVTCMQKNIKKHIDVAPPEPGAPGMFRCAQPDLIASLFRNAGLKDVAERDVPNVVGVNGPQQYWDMMTEVAAPFVAVLSKADAATVAKVKADVLADMTERYPKGNVDACAMVIMGVK